MEKGASFGDREAKTYHDQGNSHSLVINMKGWHERGGYLQALEGTHGEGTNS